MELRTLVRATVVVLCLGLTALGYRNSNGDNSDAIAIATKAACSTPDCSASLEQQARGSFGHEYSFKTERKAPGKPLASQVIITCAREWVLLGDWHCEPKPRP